MGIFELGTVVPDFYRSIDIMSEDDISEYFYEIWPYLICRHHWR